MRFLFVHQNFPGQFRHVARALAEDPAHEVVGIGESQHVGSRLRMHPRITVRGYPSPQGPDPGVHPYLRDTEGQVRRGQQMVRAAHRFKADGFEPDVIVAHPGWGEALFLGELFPHARHINYCEFYYTAGGADMGFDPEFPSSLDDRLRVPVRNVSLLLGVASCDVAVAPTEWQRSLHPAEYHAKIEVLHEGIDTTVAAPDPEATVEVAGRTLHAGQPIVTYVARGLEPYRGFHRLMRTLPRLQRRLPDAEVLIVGGDEVSYGRRLPEGETYRARYSREIDGAVDWSRIHFLGRLPHAEYLKVLQVSAAHVYLTYPFVLSWSLLEAMAAQCLVIGSDTAPVREVLRDGDNGLLVDFFDGEALVDAVAAALETPQACRALRVRARETVEAHYDLHAHCLPRWLDLVLRG